MYIAQECTDGQALDQIFEVFDLDQFAAERLQMAYATYEMANVYI